MFYFSCMYFWHCAEMKKNALWVCLITVKKMCLKAPFLGDSYVCPQCWSLTLATFLSHCPHFNFSGRQVLSLSLELTNSDRLAGWQTLGFSCQELWGSTTSGFSMGARDSQSGSHASMASNSPIEPLPNQEYFFWKVHVDREVGNLSNMVKIMIYRKCFDNVDIV